MGSTGEELFPTGLAVSIFKVIIRVIPEETRVRCEHKEAKENKEIRDREKKA